MISASEASARAQRRSVIVRAAIAVAGFGAYAGAVWLGPGGAPGDSGRLAPAQATESQVRAWRGASCQTCHAVFGLGGHLGPDLTTITSRRPEGLVDAMMRNPPSGMPSFADLSESERADIVGYLRAVDGAASRAADTWFTRGASWR